MFAHIYRGAGAAESAVKRIFHKYVLSPLSFLHSIRALLLFILVGITHKASFRMSFNPSNVHLIEVENNRDLVATLKDEELGLRIDRIDLNKYLGYYDGKRRSIHSLIPR